jgi:magnesium transporter
VAPLVEPMKRLASGEEPHVDKQMAPFFRDIADHVLRVGEQVDWFDDRLASVLNANLAQVAVQQNEDMRRISAWVAMAAVPTLIAGIYGMNFDHMPELGWSFGYPAAIALMATICGLLYRGFRRSGWL